MREPGERAPRGLVTLFVGPLVVAVLAGAVGQVRARKARGSFAHMTASLPAAERKDLESAPALALANATWAFGSWEAVNKMMRIELDRLPESDGARRARVFVRFGVIDSNPDGQAALFSQACQADPYDCDHLKEAAERETKARFVSPGNYLPLFLLGGHPPIP
ncbi:MAG TPA: hypothetical protein VGP07_09350 [Polyangia bacterium]